MKNKPDDRARFAKARKNAGYRTAHALAEATGVRASTIYNFESGRKGSLSITDLLKICEATKVPISEFVPEVLNHLPDTYVDVNAFTASLTTMIKEHY